MPVPMFENFGSSPFSLTDSRSGMADLVSYVNKLSSGCVQLQEEMNWFMSKLSSVNAIEFGGYYITKTQLASRNGLVGLSSAKTDDNDIRIWAGAQKDEVPPFRVYEDGLMIASNADITGKVTAQEGAIGGWVIGANSLTDTTGKVGMSSSITAGDDVRFFAGSNTPGAAPYRVYESGAVYASNITITGGSISVASNATVGDKLILSSTNFGNGIRWGSTSMQVYIDPASQAMFLSSPGGIYANGIRVDV